MEGAHRRYFEISRQVGRDPQSSFLMDDLLDACFDHVLPPGGRGADEGDANSLARLMAALERLNTHLRSDGRLPGEGLFVGTPEQISAWAEDLTWQIWENRPD